MQSLEGFGSYRDNASNSEMIMGHDNTHYMIGGNTEYKIQSNVISWDLIKNSTTPYPEKHKLDFIKSILNLSNSDDAFTTLKEVMRLDDREFIEYIENSLNLNESIIVELRRMFYTFIEYIQIFDKSDYNIKDKKFCHKNPKKCIIELLESVPSLYWISKLPEYDIYRIMKNINSKLEIRDEIRNTQIIKVSDVTVNESAVIDDWIDFFMETYKEIQPILEKIESINDDIAKKLDFLNLQLELEL